MTIANSFRRNVPEPVRICLKLVRQYVCLVWFTIKTPAILGKNHYIFPRRDDVRV